jgi:5'-AMP-activated protein kinase catalytic alpha subunit
MAPEIHLLTTYDGRRADVWALGVLAFELLHRYLPFDAPNLEALKMRIIKGHRSATSKTLSPGARALVHQMLAVDPAERPDSAQLCAHPWLTTQPLSRSQS